MTRRGANLLPSFFTMANIFCGYFALTETLQAAQLLPGGLAEAAQHFDNAAKAIGFAVLFDGLDGRVARLMGTSSAFGKELDSIADAITFGIAPAFLALTWGVQAVLPNSQEGIFGELAAAGWVVSFVFVLCSVARLARFNIQTGPTIHAEHQENRFFVGLPTPASAGLVAAVVHFQWGFPVEDWHWTPFWFVVLSAVSMLMISTWKYPSFKHLELRNKRKSAVVVTLGTIAALIWFYSHVFLLIFATTYVMSGIVFKLMNALRKKQPAVDSQEHLAAARRRPRP